MKMNIMVLSSESIGIVKEYLNACAQLEGFSPSSSFIRSTWKGYFLFIGEGVWTKEQRSFRQPCICVVYGTRMESLIMIVVLNSCSTLAVYFCFHEFENWIQRVYSNTIIIFI